MHPDGIILFGSYSKGEDIENSDIDIAIISEKYEKSLNLNKYSKSLGKEISIHIYEDMNKETKKSVLNGIILRGFIE